jgi:type VI secretion system protein ImpM
MGCGLYGKLPAKRDFVAISTSRAFLDVWEPWLQSSVAASRMRLGSDWQAAYLKAPIWRFWLGANLCGSTAAGALMPSVDGVGRYFPLTAFAVAARGAAIPPPDIDAQEPWYWGLEDLLLAALDEAVDFDRITEAIEALPGPTALPVAAVRCPSEPTSAPLAVSAGPPAGRDRGSAPLSAEAWARAASAGSVWWTAGGADYAPLTARGLGMPDPHAFAGMLTGRFEKI